ncbi:respiratory nitrate reductase beta subunit [Sediminihabitans luteus]|uniref:Respiratory nitrate reductase beta subunit n=2 Tax=Sediminihabitans luteus TaxID=1138585 RepID=A0A2M9CEW3_9CELL|nr:4Fe-4S dicluster domain-containing protein [Sediminihabitans luteus]PJJ70464.1 respiratory nitrate reductase beta subunit [Sediminihabitans luteus]
MAQMAMVMHLDRCIGCHTCSVACKQVQSTAEGLEYAWFNNVETRPGRGYPHAWDEREATGAGWVRASSGTLRPRGGGRLASLAQIFAAPGTPVLAAYDDPVAEALRSRVAGPAPETMGGARGPEPVRSPAPRDSVADDAVLAHLSEHVTADLAETFSFYLPRLCEHCLNPACVAACPSGAMYKRVEDGIVLVDQHVCRGWARCVPACPYKKVYLNPVTGKATKCTLCVERIEAGEPTLCSDTCVGRLRYIGLVLYDADKVEAAAAVADPHDLLDAQRDVILDPNDPDVVAAAERSGIPEEWVMAAQWSPIWQLVSRFRVALPLHPEYRTLPMVWYVPPLSPVVDVVAATGADGEDFATLAAAFEQLAGPVDYLAEMFAAGAREPVTEVLRRLAAVRAVTAGSSGSSGSSGAGASGAGASGAASPGPTTSARPARGRRGGPDPAVARAVGLDPGELTELHQLLTKADYADRNVIPEAYAASAQALAELGCSLDEDGGPGMGAAAPPGAGPAVVAPAGGGPAAGGPAGDGPAAGTVEATRGGRFNLLGWTGRGRPHQLFPAPAPSPARPASPSHPPSHPPSPK